MQDTVMNKTQKDLISKLLGTVMPYGIVNWKKIISDDLRTSFVRICNFNISEGVYGDFDDITIYLVKTVYLDVRIIISVNGCPVLIPSDSELDTAAEYLYIEIDRRIMRESDVYEAVTKSLENWKEKSQLSELLDIREILNMGKIE